MVMRLHSPPSFSVAHGEDDSRARLGRARACTVIERISYNALLRICAFSLRKRTTEKGVC